MVVLHCTVNRTKICKKETSISEIISNSPLIDYCSRGLYFADIGLSNKIWSTQNIKFPFCEILSAPNICKIFINEIQIV